MRRHRLSQAWISLAHALHSLGQRRITMRPTPRKGAHLADPGLHALMRRTWDNACGAWPQPFDADNLGDALRVDPAVLQHNGPSQGMANEDDWKGGELLQELGEVEDILDHRIVTAARPLGIPM